MFFPQTKIRGSATRRRGLKKIYHSDDLNMIFRGSSMPAFFGGEQKTMGVFERPNARLK